MNIFYVDHCPIESAKFLASYDKIRHNKMILETAQILCSALHKNGFTATYRPTHLNHPCVIWASQSKLHFNWLVRYFSKLHDLYLVYYRVNHKSGELLQEFISGIDKIKGDDIELPPNCARNTKKGLDFGNEKDIRKAYKLYLKCQWKKERKNIDFYNI
jgi:hypothetical protein